MNYFFTTYFSIKDKASTPNPSVDVVNITFKKPIDATISLLNNSGQILTNTEVNNVMETQINLKDLLPGVYFLAIESDGQIFQKEIVKQ